MEKQKPKGLINGVIKEEIDDFVGGIKEEPLDEEYLKQNIPKYEEVVDPCQQSSSHCFNMSNNEISNSSSQVFKQKPVFSEPRSAVAMGDVKMEPIEDFVDDLNSQIHLNHKFMEKPNRRVYYNRRCSVCFQMKSINLLKDVTSGDEQLIIIIGCLLRKRLTLKKAHSYLTQKKGHMCRSHISYALSTICNTLRIEHFDSLCSRKLGESLMFTVNSLYPQWSALRFFRIFRQIAARNDCSIRKSLQETNEEKYARCLMCHKSKCCEMMEQVSNEDDKLMIMIGCILHRDYTFEEARLFISQDKSFMICHSHISEAYDKICIALKIKNPHEFPGCSADSMKNIINIANTLCPKFISWQFHTKFSQFFCRNKHII